MELVKVLPYVAYIIGAGSGVFWPFFRKHLEEGVPLEWSKIKGKVVVAILGLFLIPTLGDTLQQLAGLGWVVAFGMGLAATTVGHEAQKTPGAIAEGKRLERL